MALLRLAAAAAAALVMGSVPLAMAQGYNGAGGNSLQYPTYFNWSLPDTSAMFDFWPVEAGVWNASFTQSSWASYVPGQSGMGTSSHSSNSSSSPSVMFNLPLTAFYVYGKARLDYSNADSGVFPLSLIVDSRNPTNVTPSDGLICSVENLLWGFHKIQLTLYSGAWEVTGIRMVTGASLTVPSLENVTMQQELFVDPANGTLNDFYDYTDGWTAQQTIGGGGGQRPTNYSHALGQGTASTNLTIPSGTAWVVLYGAVRPDSTDFTLVWEPLPPLTDSDMRFASNNPWQSPSTFYVAPLLPEVNYTLQIVGSDVNNSVLALHSMEFYFQSRRDKSNRSYSSGVNKGAIAGGVVGGVVGVALIAFLVWFFIRRRRREGSAKGTKGSNSTDESHSEQLEMDDIPPIAEPAPVVAPARAEDKPPGVSPTGTDGDNRRQQLYITTATDQQIPAGSVPLSANPNSSSTNSGYSTFVNSASVPGQSSIQTGSSRLVASNPDPSYTPPSTMVAGSSSEPVHPMAAELKHGPTRRQRPLRGPPRTRQVEQETDGGAIVAEDVELVPPVYNPEWARGRGVVGVDEPLSPITTSGAGLNSDSPSLSPTTPASYTSVHTGPPSALDVRQRMPHSLSPIVPLSAASEPPPLPQDAGPNSAPIPAQEHARQPEPIAPIGTTPGPEEEGHIASLSTDQQHPSPPPPQPLPPIAPATADNDAMTVGSHQNPASSSVLPSTEHSQPPP